MAGAQAARISHRLPLSSPVADHSQPGGTGCAPIDGAVSKRSVTSFHPSTISTSWSNSSAVICTVDVSNGGSPVRDRGMVVSPNRRA